MRLWGRKTVVRAPPAINEAALMPVSARQRAARLELGERLTTGAGPDPIRSPWTLVLTRL
jgi:hypothetical protein